MSTKFKKALLVMFLMVNSICLFANGVNPITEPKPIDSKETLREEIKEDIAHHIKDSHYFSIFSDKKENSVFGFPLPVILFDNGLKLFSSCPLVNGGVANIDGNYYKEYHSKIYKTDAAGTIDLDKVTGHVANAKPWDFSITKCVFSIMSVCALLLLVFGRMAKSYKNSLVPSGIAKFFEPIVLYIKDDIAIPNIGEHKYKKYMNFLLTVFFFIWFSNLLGLTPFGVNITGNIAVTLSLALFTFLITNLTGTKTYWGHLFNPLGDSVSLLGKIVLYIIIIPVELLGVIIKPFALMIRLFANISAGHIVIMSLIGMIFIFKNWIGGSMSFLLSCIIFMIELLVALLQAYIFTMLSALYFGFAADDHHGDGVHDDL